MKIVKGKNRKSLVGEALPWLGKRPNFSPIFLMKVSLIEPIDLMKGQNFDILFFLHFL